jgi:folylpolyglutamate synthase/dihydropteroate synthase
MPRSLKANELKSVAEKYCKCDMAESYEKAIEMARDNPIFIFGSLYLAADMRKFFKKD